MRDAAGRVAGIRRRFPDGRKLSVKGGHEGLFVPDGVQFGDELFVCEGPTDAAAMLSLGFNVVGRPSCRGGVPVLVALMSAHQPTSLVILGDGDRPGQDGALALASMLRLYVPLVRACSPPSGIKDARQWLQLGATRADVRRLVEGTESIGLTIKTNQSWTEPPALRMQANVRT